ncbi:hypothetical protein HYC85_020209 [Camellia sinensis]|uniref:Uncharacterized protein n=1 Tax=Camellia sinensis TaxID=4442 RepID=A0A7J7GQ03_CAMSI|nr:hypothetical protein HYC85_020209 [Camellia sinensis]
MINGWTMLLPPPTTNLLMSGYQGLPPSTRFTYTISVVGSYLPERAKSTPNLPPFSLKKVDQGVEIPKRKEGFGKAGL